MDLISKFQGITLRVFDPILLTAKNWIILIIQDNCLAEIAHASSNRVGEKAFFKESENKLVKLFYFEETRKNGEIQEHVFPWTRNSRVANFIYYTFGWWRLLLYTIFFVASTSSLKCYSRPWLCSWLFSEETLCESLVKSPI